MKGQRGSVLILAILVAALVGMIILAGTAYYAGFSREAPALESRLQARHLAASGLALFETSGVIPGEGIPGPGGRIRLTRVVPAAGPGPGRETDPPAAITVRSTGFAAYGSRMAEYTVEADYRRNDGRWVRLGARRGLRNPTP